MGATSTMRLLKTAVVVSGAMAMIAGTSVVAFAYPPPEKNETLTCQPGSVPSGGHCTLTFTDKDKHGNARAGQTICFSQTGGSGSGTITPQCSTTDKKGKATATFTGGSCGSVTITGQEQPRGSDDQGGAQTTVQVTGCGGGGDKGHHDDGHGNNGDGKGGDGHGNSHQNAAALLPSTQSTSVGGTILGIGVIVAIIALAVAVAGRLQLRRLRR